MQWLLLFVAQPLLLVVVVLVVVEQLVLLAAVVQFVLFNRCGPFQMLRPLNSSRKMPKMRKILSRCLFAMRTAMKDLLLQTPLKNCCWNCS